MAVYKVTNTESPLSVVEFTPVADGNFSFFHVKTPAQAEEIKQWLVSKDMGQEIVAETMVGGQPVLITHGDKTKEDLMKLLSDHGDTLTLEVHKKPFNFWALRGIMGFTGQFMQLASALIGVEQADANHPKLNSDSHHYTPSLEEGMHVRKPFAADIGVFAILNIIANGANIIYGGQKEKGENRLRHIKGMINDNLGEHLAIGDTPIGIDENRADRRQDLKAPPSALEKLNTFAKENSVKFFETGLRYLASVALVVPFKKENLGKGLAQLGKGSVREAWNAVRNPNKLVLTAGAAYLTGKSLGMLAKVPDPYDPKPHTWIDTVREKYLFKLDSAIESIAGASIMVNAYKTKKIGWHSPDRPDIVPYTDWLGTVGGGLFAGGYLVRMKAKFGEKEVDMDEVYAHATDTLAKTPPDQFPQLMADTAASLKDHFKDKPIEFSEIFTRMMTDMYHYHHIALDNLGTEPAERAARLQPSGTEAINTPEPAQEKYTLAHPSRRPAERVPVPAAYVDKVTQPADTTPAALGVGA